MRKNKKKKIACIYGWNYWRNLCEKYIYTWVKKEEIGKMYHDGNKNITNSRLPFYTCLIHR